MLKPTGAKVAVLMMLVAVIAVPALLVGNGPALIVPVMAVFWLDGLVHALGVQVSANGGVDAFNLIPPNTLGTVLILLGSAVSLGVLYATAAWLVVRGERPARPEGASG